MLPMNLANALIDAFQRHPEKAAIYWGGEIITYAQIVEESDWIRNYLLKECQVNPGDRVALWMKNTPEFISILYGVLRAGAVVVPLNYFLTAPEAELILRDSGAKVIFVDDAMYKGANCMREVLPEVNLCHIKNLSAGPSETEQIMHTASVKDEDDLALIIYTSGTTGRSKGAMLTHGNLAHNVNSCVKTMRVSETDKIVLLLPMSHSFMVTVGILLPIKVGGSIVLIQSLHPPKNILQEIIAAGATILPAIPPFYRAFASSSLPELPLRLCISGAAPLPREVLKKFNRQSNMSLLESYGLSEASPVVTLNPVDGPWKAGSIGLPIHDVAVAIMNEQGLEVSRGQTGELWVKGGNVMKGYWNRPEASAEALCHGWLRTGDMGHADEEGYIYVTDRKKDMLLVNGINVYPREIEELIYECEGVKEVSVVGQIDQRKGELPVAFIVMEDGCNQNAHAILEALKPKLAAYKIPRKILFIGKLPRNATGKVLKTVLRKQLQA